MQSFKTADIQKTVEEIKEVSLISDKQNIAEWIKIILDDPSELLVDESNFTGEETRVETDCISFEHIDIIKVLSVKREMDHNDNPSHKNYYGNVELEIKAYFIIHSAEILIFKQCEEVGIYYDTESEPHCFEFNQIYEILFEPLEGEIQSLPNILRYTVDREVEKKVKAHYKSLKRMNREKRIMEKKVHELNNQILDKEKNLTELKKIIINMK